MSDRRSVAGDEWGAKPEFDLRQTFDDPISGYWDGGPRKVFVWEIDHHHVGHDAKGTFVRVGSWGANQFFNVAAGKTDKQTLANAKRSLSAKARRAGKNCKFEYVPRLSR